MKLTLEISIDSRSSDELNTLNQLIKEGWEIESIWSINEQNKNFKFNLIRK